MQLPLVGLLLLLAAQRLRRPRLCLQSCALLALAAWASPANAAVDFYRVGKTIAYSQTSNSPPTTAISFSGGVDMATQAPLDFASARVFSTTTMPPSPVPEFILTQFSPGYWGSSQFYPSLAEMDANLPPGDTFGYLIEGGTLGSQLALLPLPAIDLFSPVVPHYTGSTYSQLNGLDTTAPYTIHWNGYTPAAGITESPIFFTIYRVSDGQNITGTVVSNTTTSFPIPANTLAPNTHYKASLDYSSRQNMLDAGFFTADSSPLYDVVTELEFTTRPFLAGDYNRNYVVDAADYTVWRNTLGQTGVSIHSGADGDGDGKILAADYFVWKNNYGMTSPTGSFAAVPEPAALLLTCFGLTAVTFSRIIRHRLG